MHSLPSSHVFATPAAQTLAAQLSPTVHGLPSSQAPAPAVCVQPSLSHASAVHALPSSQLTVALPTHWVPWQASPVVHALPSSQDVALLARCTQPGPGWHASFVHAFWSLQSVALPLSHLPAVQTSPVVQALPSEHGSALGACPQPVPGTQRSVVHGSLSPQDVVDAT